MLRVAIVCFALALAGCVNIQLPGGLPEPLVETEVRPGTGPKILLVSIDGVIHDQRGPVDLFGYEPESPVARLREELEQAAAPAHRAANRPSNRRLIIGDSAARWL